MVEGEVADGSALEEGGEVAEEAAAGRGHQRGVVHRPGQGGGAMGKGEGGPGIRRGGSAPSHHVS